MNTGNKLLLTLSFFLQAILSTSIAHASPPPVLSVLDLHLGNLETETLYDGVNLNVHFEGDYSELTCEWGEELEKTPDDLNTSCSCGEGSCYVNFHTTLSEISYVYPISISHVASSQILQMHLSFNVDDSSFGGGDTPGCTDPNAVNYNPNATIDDGSCEYQ